MAQMTRDDFVTALKNRGWKRYADADLQKFVDFGLEDVARQGKWTARLIQAALDTTAVASGLSVASVDKLYITTSSYERKLEPMEDELFFKVWLPKDDSDSNNQDTPIYYYVYDDTIWLLPFPDKVYDLKLFYYQSVPYFINGASTSGLVESLDPAILAYSEAYCFRRAHELDRMAESQQEGRRICLDELAAQEMLFSEQEDRVEPWRG